MNRLELRERVARVEDIVAQEVRHRAFEGVRAGLRLRADDARGRPELGIVVGGRDLGLGHGFERRIDHDQPEHRVVIVRAVEQMRRSGEALAVDDLSIRSLRVLARRGLRRRRLHARRQQFEGGEAPVQDGQTRDGLLAVGDRHVAALGLEQRSPRAHLERLAQLRRPAASRRGSSPDRPRRSPPARRRGTLRLDADRVAAGDQKALCEEA